MQLKIVRKPSSDLVKVTKLKMKLAHKKQYTRCIVFGVLGVTLLIIGISDFGNFGIFFMSAGLLYLIFVGRFLYQSSVLTTKVLKIVYEKMLIMMK